MIQVSPVPKKSLNNRLELVARQPWRAGWGRQISKVVERVAIFRAGYLSDWQVRRRDWGRVLSGAAHVDGGQRVLDCWIMIIGVMVA